MDRLERHKKQDGAAYIPRFQDLLALIFRNKWFLIVSVVAGLVIAVIYTMSTPALYEGTATVLINARVTQQVNPFVEHADGTGTKLANEIGILRTRSLARKVVELLRANPWLDTTGQVPLPILVKRSMGEGEGHFTTTDTVIARLDRAVTFIPERESDIIRIIATSGERREASLIANAYAEAYREEVLQQSRSQSRAVREFLEGRLSEQRTQLKHAEGQMKSYMESAGISSLDGESNRVVQELSQLEGSRNSLTIEIESLNRKLASLESELPRQELSVINTVGQASDPYIQMLSEQVARLEVQRDVVIAQNDPAVLSQGSNKTRFKEMDEQLAALRKKLEERTNAFIKSYVPGDATSSSNNPLVYLQTIKQNILESRFQLESLRSRRVALDSIISVYENKFRRIPRHSMDFARLQRERLSSEKLYGLVEEKFNEAAISEKSEYGYVEIIDRESPETVVGRTSILINMALGFLVALIVSLGIVLIREAMDVRVRSPEQLQRSGFVCLGEIAPLDKELAEKTMHAEIPSHALGFDPRLQLIYNPLSYTAECFRRLRVSIIRANQDPPLRVLLFTSPNPGEGKTSTALNLALSLAETEQRTLVIDADVRRPRVHSLLGLDTKPGLSELTLGLVKPAQAVRRNVVPFLDVLPCGSSVKLPSSLFGKNATLDALSALMKEYTWVVIDTPPALVVNDAAVMAAIVDATIIMVDAGETRMSALERAADIMEQAGCKRVGVVISRFDAKSAYGGYYGGPRYGHYDNRNHYYGEHTREDSPA
jgi:capsular exopolysaccharide synthesis family protein